MTFQTLSKQIGDKLKEEIATVWDGKKAILDMKSANSPHWRQMEWTGFYFQHLCEKILSELVEIPGPRHGNVKFDGFKDIPWDFKAHAMNTSSHQIIVNDREAIENGIKNYHHVGVILALGEVTYNDEKRTFQKWHSRLKGGK